MRFLHNWYHITLLKRLLRLDLQALGIVLSSIEGSFAIRTYIGGVNAISGRPLATTSRLLRNIVGATTNTEGHAHDYIVLPNQSRLDGIAIAPDCVAQFVATQMKSKEPAKDESNKTRKPAIIRTSGDNPLGSSIEHQVTSEDTIGGIQLEITPAICPEVMFFSKKPRMRSWFPTGWPVINQFDRHDVEENAHLRTGRLDPMKTPAELDLKPGECLYMKDVRKIKPCRPKIALDLLQELPNGSQGLRDRVTLKVQKWTSIDDVPAAKIYNHLLVLTLTGKKLVVRLSTWKGMQVYALKVWIEEVEGIPLDQIVLFYKGETLWDGK